MQDFKCTICGANSKKITVFKVNDCIIRNCAECGVGSADVQGFDAENYYTEDYFNGGHPDGYVDYAGSREILKAEFSNILTLLSSHLSPGSRVLEIGCAHGFFLSEASKKFEVYGVEISKSAVLACMQAGLSNVHQGVVSESVMERIGPVDAIVLLDVIEHLEDPAFTLKICERYLTPNGLLIISTGDYGSIASRVMGRRWRLMTPPQHLWFFTQRAMLKLAAALRLNVMEISHPWKFVPLSLLIFQAARMVGISLNAGSLGALSKIGVPVNLFDAMRVVLRKGK